MNHTIRNLASALLLALCMPGWTQQLPMVGPAPDISKWVCKECPYEWGLSTILDLGAIYVSDDSFKYADYTGREQGSHAVLDGDLIYLSTDSFWQFKLSDMGLDSRSLTVDGGKLGFYRARFSYSELPHLINETGMTPYSGVGSSELSLPGDWITASRTDELLDLNGSLQPLALELTRKTFQLGLALTPPGNWNYSINYEHQDKEGNKPVAAGFLFTTSLLPAPVDYGTDQINADVSYQASHWQLKLAYYGSFFDNDDSALVWQNAFNPLIPGADTGQLALPPDNELNMISLSGTYRMGDRSRLSGIASVGQMEQDEPFLPYTINDQVITTPLPRTSADAEVDLFDVGVRFASRLNSKLNLKARFQYQERDNKTPQSEYQPVITDLTAFASRTNLPLSFEKKKLDVDLKYRLARELNMTLGLARTEHERTFQEVRKTDENRIWSDFRVALFPATEVSIRFLYEDREGGRFEPIITSGQPENPALRNFNLADRERRQAQFTANVAPGETLQFGLDVGISADTYSNSEIGLTESDDTDSTFDFSWTPKDNVLVHGYYSWESIEADINGSLGNSSPDWFGATDDTIKTLGGGIEFNKLANEKLNLGIDYVYSRSESDYQIDSGEALPPFPELTTRLEGYRLKAAYHVRENLLARFDFYHEKYRTADWALDGVAPDTIFNALTFGELGARYSVDQFSVRLQYRF